MQAKNKGTHIGAKKFNILMQEEIKNKWKRQTYQRVGEASYYQMFYFLNA